MQENSAGRIVLISCAATAVTTAAILFFGLHFAENEPIVFFAAGLAAFISALITAKMLKRCEEDCGILFFWVFPAVCLFGLAMLSYNLQMVAGSKRESEQTAAHEIFIAAIAAAEEMQEEGISAPESPYIVICRNEPEPDSFAARIKQYCGDVSRGRSYAVMLHQTKDCIQIDGVYWAPFSDLTPDTLIETPQEEQIRQLGRLFRQKPPVFFCKNAKYENND